jgi:hypothetical protein
VEVKIGVQNVARELTIDIDDASAEAVEKQVADAVSGDGLLTLTDTKGRKIVVPGAKLAYVEIGHGTLGTVGFRG